MPVATNDTATAYDNGLRRTGGTPVPQVGRHVLPLIRSRVGGEACLLRMANPQAVP